MYNTTNSTLYSSEISYRIFPKSLQLAKKPIIIALFLTPVRFMLELAGLPEAAIFLVGLLWLTLGISIYWGIILHQERQPFLTLLLSLLIFSPVSRIPVAILWWVDNKFSIGSHYGLYFDNFQQAIFNQVFYGSLIQVIAGCVIGAITLAIMQHRKSLKK